MPSEIFEEGLSCASKETVTYEERPTKEIKEIYKRDL